MYPAKSKCKTMFIFTERRNREAEKNIKRLQLYAEGSKGIGERRGGCEGGMPLGGHSELPVARCSHLMLDPSVAISPLT